MKKISILLIFLTLFGVIFAAGVLALKENFTVLSKDGKKHPPRPVARRFIFKLETTKASFREKYTSQLIQENTDKVSQRMTWLERRGGCSPINRQNSRGCNTNEQSSGLLISSLVALAAQQATQMKRTNSFES